MLIEEKLPQFVDDKSFLVVAGESAAKFYLASNGVVDELEPFQLPKLHYSDREGFFARKSAQNISSGSVYESPKEYLHEQFFHGLVEKIKRGHQEHQFRSIYLFSPEYMLKGLVEVLPKEFHSMIRLKFVGNLTTKHPFELLQLINGERENTSRRQKIIGSEARKLLDKQNA